MQRYLLPESKQIDDIVISKVAVPKPKRGQALVRMYAASLNYRDLIIAIGRYRLPANKQFGVVPLSDGAGEVVEVGEDVTRVKQGDRVVNTFIPGLVTGQATVDSLGRLRGAPNHGVLAEYVVFEAEDLVILPDSVSYTGAACLPCAGVTAWNSLYCGPQPLLPGQSALVLGTGGVAVLAVQLAHAGGARVIVTSGSDKKLKQVLRVGASAGINYKSHPEWQEEVKRLTGGRGVDHTVETGGPGTLSRSVAATRFGGSVGMIGVLVEGQINPIEIMHQGLVVRSVLTGSRSMLEDLVRAIDFHEIKIVIDRIFPFSEAVAAYRHLEKAGHVGKVVISMDK
ncbi:MAG: NAD(P)-dependent alcohol dehydrogenase [Gammaproteobacteria bacterium]|nr:NAD(P)-dependent alcohol dehydrogenase [Gammaproteobacteria bacterium]